MKHVYEEYGGLMEHPHYTPVYWGCGEGDTLKEVVEYIIKRNPEKGEYIKFEGPNVYDWGMKLFVQA